MRLKPLLFGLATFVPGVYSVLSKPTGGTDSARYCYSVWLRHLVMARRHGLDGHPAAVLEIGPGDSLGVGVAALLTGSSRYIAIDAVQRASSPVCLAVFDELLGLLHERADIPGEDEFPRVRPMLPSYAFPASLLPDAHLAFALQSERVAALRARLANLHDTGPFISYVRTGDAHLIPHGSADLVLSQGVLEYPADLPRTYGDMSMWLRPGGVASHAIDFGAHQTTDAWDGHWAISEFGWACLRGRQPYFLNRATHSCHLADLSRAGLTIVCDQVEHQQPQTRRTALAPRFQSLSDDDLMTRAAFVQAIKRARAATTAAV